MIFEHGAVSVFMSFTVRYYLRAPSPLFVRFMK